MISIVKGRRRDLMSEVPARLTNRLLFCARSNHTIAIRCSSSDDRVNVRAKGLLEITTYPLTLSWRLSGRTAPIGDHRWTL